MKFARIRAATWSALSVTLILFGCSGSSSPSSSAPPPSSGTTPPQSTPEGWISQAHDAQHTGVSAVESQALSRIHWQMPVDLMLQLTSGGDLLVHYGSPLVTAQNTVIVPVKTGALNGFRVEARAGSDGSTLWTLDTDYSAPADVFLPSFGPTLSNNRVVMPAAGGTILVRDNADAAAGTATRMAFYGLPAYNSDSVNFDSNVQINTPITADSQGNLYFGFIVTGPTSPSLQSGLARVGIDGGGTWISAAAASGDPAIIKVNMSCAPALSADGTHLYVAVDSADGGFGYLLELDATTLQPINKVRLLDPALHADADISDESSASPTVGPDGDVFYGVLESALPSHHDRGWLLHFSSDLTVQKTPGAFGWDDTASIVDASLVPSYHGTSQYLVLTKYNDYAGAGGSGRNEVAILDPNATQADAILGNPVMKEVLTVLGKTPDPAFSLPGAVREWCINMAAVDPFTKSVLVNSEDGKLYRWDLTSNQLTESMTLTGGLGEAYTPTLIGADGTVYAINRGVLFAVGGN
jgi:hypothetical protein